MARKTVDLKMIFKSNNQSPDSTTVFPIGSKPSLQPHLAARIALWQLNSLPPQVITMSVREPLLYKSSKSLLSRFSDTGKWTVLPWPEMFTLSHTTDTLRKAPCCTVPLFCFWNHLTEEGELVIGKETIGLIHEEVSPDELLEAPVFSLDKPESYGEECINMLK